MKSELTEEEEQDFRAGDFNGFPTPGARTQFSTQHSRLSRAGRSGSLGGAGAWSGVAQSAHARNFSFCTHPRQGELDARRKRDGCGS